MKNRKAPCCIREEKAFRGTVPERCKDCREFFDVDDLTNGRCYVCAKIEQEKSDSLSSDE